MANAEWVPRTGHRAMLGDVPCLVRAVIDGRVEVLRSDTGGTWYVGAGVLTAPPEHRLAEAARLAIEALESPEPCSAAAVVALRWTLAEYDI